MQAYGHNRARQREKLGALLEEMGDLQTEVFFYKKSIFVYQILSTNFEIHSFYYKTDMKLTTMFDYLIFTVFWTIKMSNFHVQYGDQRHLKG